MQFMADLFGYLKMDVFEVTGKKSQDKNNDSVQRFVQAKSGALFCSNSELISQDLKKVDWIIRFDPPKNMKEIADLLEQAASNNGVAVLFLLAHEGELLTKIRKSKVGVREFNFPENKLANNQAEINKLIERNYQLNLDSRDAYRAYIRFYHAHAMKAIFDLKNLDLQKSGHSFGMEYPPRITLDKNANQGKPAAKKGHKKSLKEVLKQSQEYYKQKGKVSKRATEEGEDDEQCKQSYALYLILSSCIYSLSLIHI
eukprot:TRINITY_DN5593_c0_g2_i2.p1 TRINITY_DN5593_c0_g2~~TRINITY_DN5593_c0_g2_i2.p1  ORF type:complete len:256 (+),score=67.92 TRINITY_DN5593_c0_g2_i2:294-1061(+)